MLAAIVAGLAISMASAEDSAKPVSEQEKIKLQNSKIYIFPSVIEPDSIKPAQPKADGTLPEDNAFPVDPKKETGAQPKDQPNPVKEPVPIEEKPVELIEEGGNVEEKLPPIPLMPPSILSKFPPFIQSLFGGAADPRPPMQSIDPEPFGNDVKSNLDETPKRHLMSILFFKSFKNGGDQQGETSGNKKLVIMKLIPSSGESGEPKAKVHLFGGKDDPDNMLNNFYQQQNLFGGDDDIFDHMMLTGNEDSKMNEHDDDDDDDDDDDNDSHEDKRPDGDSEQSILGKIRKMFGYSSYSDDKKDCFMMNLMRIRASMYYRTLMHLLFFTGIILLILFIAILTMRSMKRRRYMRQYNDLRVATIQDETKSLANSEKFMMPPPYEQIIVNDSAVKFVGRKASQSSLVNSLAQAYKSRSQSSTLTEDNKSLPDYEEVAKNKPDQQEK